MSVEQVITAAELSLTDPKAQVFSLEGTQLLTAGRTDTVVAKSDDMTARVKVYAEGGENATHTHLNEDHVFFVLQGEATFHLGRNADEKQIVSQMSGILLPKGSYYRFQSTGTENLVLYRVGSFVGDSDRVGPTGAPLPSRTKENNHVVGVPAEGKLFRAK
ncbi:MAG TPA: cupin domain-containing protein [Acidimicrobiales bacterium]|nr:cupin domain-containing protein [Acidimicrobiales bacterium]